MGENRVQIDSGALDANAFEIKETIASRRSIGFAAAKGKVWGEEDLRIHGGWRRRESEDSER